MTIECYNSSCPKHCNNEGGEGPFCYEDTCVEAGSPIVTPYSATVDAMIHDTRNSRITKKDEIVDLLAAAAEEGKWSLIAPDGRAWIGSTLPEIAMVVLSSLGKE